MGDMIKLDNDFNKIKLGELREKEQDLFFSLLYKTQNQESRVLEIDFSELKNLVEVSDNKLFVKYLENLSDKLAKFTQKVTAPNGHIYIFSLFNEFEIQPDEKKLYISVSEKFKYLLNDLQKFTILELKTLVSLPSKYSKILYRLLSQYNSTCWFEITLEDFKKFLGVPSSYRMFDIDRRILEPFIFEMFEIFPDLKIEKIKKGREIASFKFVWSQKGKAKISKKKTKAVTGGLTASDYHELYPEQAFEVKKVVQETIKTKVTQDEYEEFYKKWLKDNDVGNSKTVRMSFENMHKNNFEIIKKELIAEEIKEEFLLSAKGKKLTGMALAMRVNKLNSDLQKGLYELSALVKS